MNSVQLGSLFVSAAIASAEPTAVQEQAPNSAIVKTVDSLWQIALDQPAGTLFLYDIDDTLLDSRYMLGRAWRGYVREETAKINGNDVEKIKNENWHDIFAYYLCEKNYPLISVEPGTASYVAESQSKGYAVGALTSRERKRYYDLEIDGVDKLTVSQLASIGVYFDNQSIENHYRYLTHETEYFQGIFFSDQDAKGDYLTTIFSKVMAERKANPNAKIELPVKVIFVDDKLSQVESVAKALAQFGIEHECYVLKAASYRKLDKLVASIQFYHLQLSDGATILTNEEAAEIGKAHPEYDEAYYFNLSVELAKSRKTNTELSN